MIRNSMDANYEYKTVTHQQPRPGELNFGSQIHLDSIWLIGFSKTVDEIFSNHINHHFSMISPFLARKSPRLPRKKLTFDVFFWSHSATNKPQNNSIWDQNEQSRLHSTRVSAVDSNSGKGNFGFISGLHTMNE